MRLMIKSILTLILFAILGCEDERKFPLGKNLTELKQTDFIPTLDHELTTERNAIYSVTLLYAWDEIKNSLRKPIQIDNSLRDLKLIDKAKQYSGALKDGEYTSSGIVTNQWIEARAEFRKSLPFEFELETFDNELTFENIQVRSFGAKGYNYETSEIIKIVYYKNDNNFIIKLLPKEKEHEIYLFKTDRRFKSMSEIVRDIDSKTKIGEVEKRNKKTSWRYYITHNDQVVIPKFEFNIETNYSNLEGNKFRSDGKEYEVRKAWQRTAFILDEKGTEIESETVIEAAAEEEDEQAKKPKPKKMRFDKPFFLMLRRTDSIYPYFGLWAMNTELMNTESP